MIRVLVVDDSALMRRHLTALLTPQAGFDVRTARNGAEALEAIAAFDPKVVTLDVNMPEMDGITCLSHIMVSHPRPVVMVSSITERGAEVTLQALSLGAVDFVQKPGGTISLSIERIEEEFVAKVRMAASARVRRAVAQRGGGARPTAAARPKAGAAPAEPVADRARQTGGAPRGIVVVGVSTGGPGALETLLAPIQSFFPWPIVVAQHMPAAFTGSFARRLDASCALTVQEVARQMPIEAGNVYIARGDADLVLSRGSLGPMASPVPAGSTHLWHPSVARLVASALDVVSPAQLIGVMMTGMGNDGAVEMAAIRARGGRTIAQDEATSVVFGMPGELVRLGGANLVLPLERIASQLSAWTLNPSVSRSEPRYGAR